MKSMWLTRSGAAAVLVAAMLSSGCGEFVRQSRSPSQLVVLSLLTARGTASTAVVTFVTGPLGSDIPGPGETYFNDLGQVTMSLILRDGAQLTGPTALNAVTISRYRVVYRRADGLNTPGLHVPYAFDGAVTFTVAAGVNGLAAFELVRHNAKLEPPLAILGVNAEVLTTIAEVTFYGRDQAGNEVSATGNVQINFGSFN